MTTSELVRLEPLGHARLEDTIECLCAIWTADNTIARALGVTREQYLPVARATVERALADDLGLILIDSRSDAVIGFHLCIDFFAVVSAPHPGADLAPWRQRWSAFLGRAYEIYTQRFHSVDAPLERGQVVYWNVGGLYPEWRRRGGIRQMSVRAIELHRRRGFTRILGVATHADSVKMLRRPPFTPIGELLFADLPDPDLRRITSPPHAVVAYIDLTAR